MRSDTRTTYQLSPSSSSDRSERVPYQTDPLNPKTFTALLSEGGNDILFSLLELPDAPVLSWRQTSATTPGTVQLHRPFADQRRLWTYMPPSMPLSKNTTQVPLLLVFDGRLYKDMLRLPEMLDYLIGRGEMEPVAALLVDNQDRRELQCDTGFAGHIADQVLPWLRSVYPVTSDPSQRVVYGSSLGGLAATFLAYSHPQVFGNVFSQTGWFRWRPDGDPEHHWLARQFAATPKLPLHFLIQVGNLETAQMEDGGPTQLEANRTMHATLQGKGYDVRYQEYSGGHDASSLEFPLAEGLRMLFGNG
jgi:enterochelin esterase family protein